MGSKQQPLLAAMLCLLLDVMHLMRSLFVDPVKWVMSLAQNKRNKLIKYYGGKTVLITGASSGLGEQFALELMKLSAEEGVSPINLVLSARTQTSLDLVAKNCMKLSPSSKVMLLWT